MQMKIWIFYIFFIIITKIFKFEIQWKPLRKKHFSLQFYSFKAPTRRFNQTPSDLEIKLNKLV